MINSLPSSLIETAMNYCAGSSRDRFNTLPANPPGVVFITHGHDKSVLSRLDEGYDNFITDNVELLQHIKNGEEISHDRSHEIHSQHLNLTPDEKLFMQEYTRGGLKHSAESGSALINRHLWDIHTQGKLPPSHFVYPDGHSVDLTKMNSIISRNTLHSPLVTFSGIKFDPREYAVHNQILNPGFISSSLHHEIATRYASPISGVKHVLAIHNNVGDSGLYTGRRSGISPFTEYEYIIPKRTTLHINPTPINGTTSVHGHNVIVWNATRI